MTNLGEYLTRAQVRSFSPLTALMLLEIRNQVLVAIVKAPDELKQPLLDYANALTTVCDVAESHTGAVVSRFEQLIRQMNKEKKG